LQRQILLATHMQRLRKAQLKREKCLLRYLLAQKEVNEIELELQATVELQSRVDGCYNPSELVNNMTVTEPAKLLVPDNAYLCVPDPLRSVISEDAHEKPLVAPCGVHPSDSELFFDLPELKPFSDSSIIHPDSEQILDLPSLVVPPEFEAPIQSHPPPTEVINAYERTDTEWKLQEALQEHDVLSMAGQMIVILSPLNPTLLAGQTKEEIGNYLRYCWEAFSPFEELFRLELVRNYTLAQLLSNWEVSQIAHRLLPFLYLYCPQVVADSQSKLYLSLAPMVHEMIDNILATIPQHRRDCKLHRLCTLHHTNIEELCKLLEETPVALFPNLSLAIDALQKGPLPNDKVKEEHKEWDEEEVEEVPDIVEDDTSAEEEKVWIWDEDGLEQVEEGELDAEEQKESDEDEESLELASENEFLLESFNFDVVHLSAERHTSAEVDNMANYILDSDEAVSLFM